MGEVEGLIFELQRLEGISPEEKAAALEVIEKLLSNIIRDPLNPKFRYIKKSNKIIKSLILLDGRPEGRNIAALLLAVGFVEDDNGFQIPLTLDERYLDCSLLETWRDVAFAVAASIRLHLEDSAKESEENPEKLQKMSQAGSNESKDERQSNNNQQRDESPKRATTPSSAAQQKDNKGQNRFRRRDDVEKKSRQATEDLAEIRRQRAEHFHVIGGGEGTASSTRPSSHSILSIKGNSGDTTQDAGHVHRSNTSGTSRGLRSFFSNIFGDGSSSSNSSQLRRRNQGNVRTLQDLPKPPPPAGK